MLETLLAFTISFLIGLLIGIERERSHAEGIQAIGVRTFILFSLLGTLAATINQFFLTVIISLFVFGIILLSYFRSTSERMKKLDIGITTEISAVIIFFLGYMVPSASFIAIVISAIVLLTLIERKRLHVLARKKFKTHEIEAIIILIIFTLGILPILPNKTVDPWQLLNPRNLGILIATIAIIQFGGYIAIRLFGERIGMLLMGFLGGLISSTAVFAMFQESLRTHPQYKNAIIASGMLATTAMLVEILIIIFVASPTLMIAIFVPIFTMIGTSIVLAMLLFYRQRIKNEPAPHLTKPLNLIFIFRVAFFIGVTLIFVAVAKRYVGTEGILLISFFGGLVEIHGVSLATALLYLDHHLQISNAVLILYTAIIASFVSKLFLLWILTPFRFALKTSALLIIILTSGGLTYYLIS